MSRSELFERERAHLFAVAYRMLASATEAEDIVQEAWLRFAAHPEKRGEKSEEEIVSVPAYLTTIVVRLALDHSKSAEQRKKSYIGPWLPEPTAETTPETQLAVAESLHLAFLVLLERLSPLERAAFVLREVFDHDFAEVATMLGTSEDACRKLVQRARAHIDEGRTRFNATEAKKRELLESFIGACLSNDPQKVAALLADDVVMRSDGGGKARAALNPVYGPDRVARFFLGALKKFVPLGEVFPEVMVVNGELAIVLRTSAAVHNVTILSVREDAITDVFLVNNPDKLRHISEKLRDPSVQ